MANTQAFPLPNCIKWKTLVFSNNIIMHINYKSRAYICTLGPFEYKSRIVFFCNKTYILALFLVCNRQSQFFGYIFYLIFFKEFQISGIYYSQRMDWGCFLINKHL